MKLLIVTVGLPRSGKSTWAKSQELPMVNPDSIRLAMYGQAFIKSMEPYVWAIAKTMVESLFIAGHPKVILDATNTTKERRRFWKSSSWTTYYHIIDTPVLICCDRTTDPIMWDVITKMDEKFEPLDQEENKEAFEFGGRLIL